MLLVETGIGVGGLAPGGSGADPGPEGEGEAFLLALAAIPALPVMGSPGSDVPAEPGPPPRVLAAAKVPSHSVEARRWGAAVSAILSPGATPAAPVPGRPAIAAGPGGPPAPEEGAEPGGGSTPAVALPGEPPADTAEPRAPGREREPEDPTAARRTAPFVPPAADRPAPSGRTEDAGSGPDVPPAYAAPPQMPAGEGAAATPSARPDAAAPSARAAFPAAPLVTSAPLVASSAPPSAPLAPAQDPPATAGPSAPPESAATPAPAGPPLGRVEPAAFVPTPPRERPVTGGEAPPIAPAADAAEVPPPRGQPGLIEIGPIPSTGEFPPPALRGERTDGDLAEGATALATPRPAPLDPAPDAMPQRETVPDGGREPPRSTQREPDDIDHARPEVRHDGGTSPPPGNGNTAAAQPGAATPARPLSERLETATFAAAPDDAVLPAGEIHTTQRAPEAGGTPPAPATAAETAKAVAVQVVSRISADGGGEFELQLSPEELGKVRLALQVSEGTVVLSIFADRPETLDLMRRHADILEREFHDAGFGSVSFSFGQGTADGRRPSAPAYADMMRDRTAETMPPSVQRPSPGQPAGASRLDLRL